MKSESNKLTTSHAIGYSPNEKIGRQIKDLRQFKRMSQRELAERADTTQATLALIESGKVNTTIGLLGKIADALEQELVLDLKRKLLR